MTKFYFSLIVLFFLIGCSNMSTLTKTIDTSPENLNEIIKEMVINENHKIESEDGLNFTTKWRRAYKEEDNHPDNTVEVRLEVSIVPEKHSMSAFKSYVYYRREVSIVPEEPHSGFSMKLMKRSSLYSADPSNITYSEIGIIQNDKLYMMWNDKIKDIEKEFKKK